MIKKLKLIYLPLLVLAASFILTYTFFNWLIFIKYELFSVREVIVEWGLPIVLVFLLTAVFFKPRLQLLKLKLKKTDFTPLYYYMAVTFIAFSVVVAQIYLKKTSGKLTELSNISEIYQHQKTKYYTVKSCVVSKKKSGVYNAAEVTGRHNENLNISLFIALPIYDKLKEGARDCQAWLGLKYSKRIKNYLSDAEKEREFEDFLEESQVDFNERDVQQFTYLDRIASSDALDAYTEALKKSPKFNHANDIVLIPSNDPFESRFNGELRLVVLSFVLGSFIWLFMLIFPSIDEKKLDAFYNKDKRYNYPLWEDCVVLFKPTKECFVTPIILVLNVIVFLMMFFSGSGFFSMKTEDLILWGANFSPYIQQGQYWRLFTGLFLHGGIQHLVFNMIGFIYVSVFLEAYLGGLRLALVYVLVGVLASCTSFYWLGDVSVGASGAILGLYGFALTLLLFSKSFPDEMKQVFLGMIGGFSAVTLISGFIYPGVDNAAHIGGFLSGALVGLFMLATSRRKAANKLFGIWD